MLRTPWDPLAQVFNTDLGNKITPFFRVIPLFGPSVKYIFFLAGKDYTMVELHQGLNLNPLAATSGGVDVFPNGR